jgi:hypothetical protein
VCYKLSGITYAQVGSSTLTVNAVAPTVFSDDGAVATGAGEIITMTSGSGLKLMSTSGDAAKAVTSSGACSDAAAGGTSEVTDLGPDNADDATQAKASFTFTIAGDYKVCYKLAGGTYAQVGSSTLTVNAVAPTGFSDDGAVTTGEIEAAILIGGWCCMGISCGC